MATQRSNIFSGDIHNLKLETIQKRLMQAGITLTAVALPLTALIAPNQSTDMKLWELGLGSLFGGAGAFVARQREDIENRHSSFLDLHREHERGSIKNEFAYHSATQEIRGELNLAGAINALRQPPVMARYMNKFQLQGLIAMAENRQSGTWVTLRNFHTRETFSGFEIGLQRLGYVGYRKSTFIEASAPC